ncbi:MAG: alpha/beta hydrolase [Microbacteriaceae bacterium]|jgi:pimeloyl-ACP methyl ester carboxylesterase|nr:alpha/beta hydrolase [Microbacteriaceae bacterium]
MSRIAVGPAEPYAPYGLDADAATAGFVVTTVRGPIGTAVARHRVARTSTRATIFLHGAAGSWTTWTPLLAAAEDRGVTIVNPVILDLPGWGDATPDPDSPPLTIDVVSELVRDVALELGYTEWDLVGHSLGGFIALHMAAIWPQSVLSVALVSGTTWSVIEGVNRPRRGLRSIPGFVLLLGAMRALAPIQPVALAVVRGLRALGVLRLASFPLFRHLSRIDATVIDALAIELRPRSFVTAAGVARNYDADTSWARIECEVRATKGDRDVFVTNDDLDRLVRVVRRACTRVVDDCGHFGHIERPAETLDALGYPAF